MGERAFAAVDLGASGGRVMVGLVGDRRVHLRPVHRFANGVVARDGHLRWDVEGLYAEVLTGLRRLARDHPEVESIGIDTWAVDYGLLDEDGTLLASPIAHRDDRTAVVIDDVHRRIDPAALFAINGLQHLPFTTLYQLEAERRGRLWPRVAHVVLLPDLLAFWLTGELRTEVTNASTTGLLEVHSRRWSAELLTAVGVTEAVLPPLQEPGAVRGEVRPEVCAAVGLRPGTLVTTVGSHDTASAVVGVPATDPGFAYVASGTWSLVGVERAAPVVTDASRGARFTNEAGVDGRTRLLRNVGGLWLLQESLRTWAEAGRPADLGPLLDRAAAIPGGGPTFDVDDPGLIAPGAMPDRIAAAIATRGEEPPSDPAGIVRAIVDSLAEGYARTARQAAALAGSELDVVHVVGGGAQNELLCQLAADRAEVPVVAGPVEATALGNVLVQARAHGAAPATLEELRAQTAATTDLRRHDPRTDAP